MRKLRSFAAALTLIAVAALAQASPAPAMAADVQSDLHFDEPTAKTIEYGEYWDYSLTTDAAFYFWVYGNNQFEVTSTGTPSSFSPAVTFYSTGSSSVYRGSLSAPYEMAPLGAGSYSFGISGFSDDYFGNQLKAETPTKAQLTIEKAKLGIELRALDDPSNQSGAIITARFTGRFVDEYQSSFFPGAAPSPAGTWKISIKNADGTVATERNVERAAGDDVLATSFYWADAEPGEQYTASATFVASGVSANNFSIAAAQDFAYTAPQSARPVPTSSATSKPDTSLPEATGFGLPLWVLILVGVLIVGMGVLVTILSVRVHRRSSPRAGEVQS